MSKGGGGGPQTSESTNVTTNLPEYARPFYEEMLGRTTYESTRPYETYQGTRIADFNPTETAAMTGMTEMAAAGAPQQIRSASDIATQIGYQPTNMGTNIAGGFNPQQQFSNYKADNLGQGYDPGTMASTYGASSRDSGYTAGTFDPNYSASQLQSQYSGQANFGPGFEAGTIADTATIQDYMNPYQQLVTDVEKQKALEASGAQAVGIQDQATQSGGLGGYREAIMQSERQKNLSDQLQNIQSTGSSAAFNQAQKAFEADRAARLQEAQLGLQTGTAGQQAQQQAEKLRQSAFGTTEQARQQQAKFGMTAQQQQQAAFQAQEQFAQKAFDAGEQAKQEAAKMGMSAQQQQEAANQAAQRFRSEAFQQNQRRNKRKTKLL